jgi:uncharacterized LabA/DUF88 family protein
MALQRVWLFIDGYNFYYSIKNSANLHLAYVWCNVRKLATDYLLDAPSQLQKIKYFTATVPTAQLETSPGEGRRQVMWLEALKTIDSLEVIYGYHSSDRVRLRREKLTDVNIAVELILGAIGDAAYDKAVLVSGDTDLIPAVNAVTRRIARPKHVDVWLPENTPRTKWERRLDRNLVRIRHITPAMIMRSRFPDKISHKGKIIECDPRWRVPLGLSALKFLQNSTNKATKKQSA